MSAASFDEGLLLPPWVLSGVASALAFTLPFKLSPGISPLFSREYRRLAPTDRLDWDSRYASTLHAVGITALAAFLLLVSDVFREDDAGAKESTPLVLRTSVWTSAALGISVGYFVVDICVVAWNCPLLGGPEMVVHHVAALASALTAAALGQGHLYTLLLLSTECTTPFLNARWWLDKLGLRFSGAYTMNGICITLTWFVGRILLFLWFFAHLWQHRGELPLLSAPAYVLLLAVPPLLFGLNVFWFSKILRGVAKLLSGTLTKEDNLGFRLQAEKYKKRKELQEKDPGGAAGPVAKPLPRQQAIRQERGDPKENLRRRDAAENFIADVATTAEAPRRKRQNSLLSG